jgi:hypothetical protein
MESTNLSGEGHSSYVSGLTTNRVDGSIVSVGYDDKVREISGDGRAYRSVYFFFYSNSGSKLQTDSGWYRIASAKPIPQQNLSPNLLPPLKMDTSSLRRSAMSRSSSPTRQLVRSIQSLRRGLLLCLGRLRAWWLLVEMYAHSLSLRP